MKKSIHMAIQIFLIGLLLSACHKDRTKHNIEASEYFPNKIGNYWEYDVYDSSQIREHPTVPRKYTVVVTITGTKKLADSVDAMVWKFEYPWGNEIKYYRNSGDTIKVYDIFYSSTLTDLLYPRLLFIKPFFDQQEWSGKLLWVDSFYVKKTVLPNFNNPFLISRKYAGQGSYDFDNFWFTERIGFVKIHRDEINQGIRTNELWQLKYYNLK
jgi:hypothetical protein